MATIAKDIIPATPSLPINEKVRSNVNNNNANGIMYPKMTALVPSVLLINTSTSSPIL